VPSQCLLLDAASDGVSNTTSGQGAGGSLREKVYKGVGWSALATILTQGLNMARSIALARLLTQDEFGLAGLLLTVIGALQGLDEPGHGRGHRDAQIRGRGRVAPLS
jgi:hypothetical protein